jgi:hypothetical protein
MGPSEQTKYPNYPTPTVYDPPVRSQAWHSGAVVRFPWLGIGALLGSVLGIVASVVILIVSDKKPISDWTFQPTVYLSIASTLTNITLYFAFTKGVTISWWRRAMKDGTHLADLHRYWDYGSSLWEASTAGRRFNLIALACVLVAIAPINGPFLQRASRVTTAQQHSTSTLGIPLAPAIPFGFSGYISGRGYDVSLYTTNFTPTVQAYNNRAPINIGPTGCGGVCSAKVLAAGFAVNCSSYPFAFDLRPSPGNPIGPATLNGTQAFISSFDWSAMSPQNIGLNIQYKKSPECYGNLVVQNCTLRSATVQYPVIINGNDSTVTLDPASTIYDDVVMEIKPTSVENRQGPTTLGGLWLALSNRFNSEAHLRWVGAVGYELLNKGATANQYVLINGSGTDEYGGFNPGTSCSLYYQDPVDDLLQSARELMFRTAVAAANSSSTQYIQAHQTSTRPIYESHYAFLAVATIVTGIAIACVSLTFHGYWQLGREFSMSPLEIATAFNAPILRGAGSNADAKTLLDEVGDRPVKYGAVGTNETSGIVREQYGTDVLPNTRLQMADPQFTRTPQEGWRFGA